MTDLVPDTPWRPGRLRLILLLPLVVFLALAVLFLVRLGAGDPGRIPSALIGHEAPATALPAMGNLIRRSLWTASKG
jgi:cytochrome c biogenesis protein CcmG, thiol:disulfide interchange protein DsbE